MSGHIFHIGEIAILCNLRAPGSRHNGRECEVLALPQPVDYLSPLNGKWTKAGCYKIRYLGHIWQCRPEWLRRPPLDPAYVKFRDQFAREFALDAEPPVLEPRHPSITAMLQLIGQDGAP